MTKLEQLAHIEKEFLTVTEVAEVLGCDPQTIRVQAHRDRFKLGFPIIILGCRIKIPRVAFIKFCMGESA